MRQIPSELDAGPVLGCYDLGVELSRIQFLGNHGGFSGARLWRVDWPGGAGCLRAWPTDHDAAEHLAFVHPLIEMARRRDLTFVPNLFRTRTGYTWVSSGGRQWELAEWLPGVADFHAHPTLARLEAASRALASLHNAWAAAGQGKGHCPAVARRLEVWKSWNELVQSGWTPQIAMHGDDPVASLAARGWVLLQHATIEVEGMLERWRNKKVLLSPCLCDIWHDHLLFDGDLLNGIIDYGAVKIDHPAVDLARMLGSLVGEHKEAWNDALIAYRQVRRIDVEDVALAAVLDTSGVILGLSNWLRWLYHDGRTFGDRTAVASRMRTLVERIEGW